MTRDEYLFCLTYVEGLRVQVREGGDGFLELRGCDEFDSMHVLNSLVKMGVHVRHFSRHHNSPFEMAINELAYVTDEMLAVLLSPLGAEEDADTHECWRKTFRNVIDLLPA
jgi:hypothetical protein